MTVIMGGATIGVINGIVPTFAALAFLFDLGEEIAADAMDVKGDDLRSIKKHRQEEKQKVCSPAVRCDIYCIYHNVLPSLPDELAWIRLSAPYCSN